MAHRRDDAALEETVVVDLELGDIMTPLPDDAEVALAEGSDLLFADGPPMCTSRIAAPDELDTALICYLLDIETH